VQSVRDAVGRRAGVLYAANTVGAVCGALLTGYLLLPLAGMQGAATLLACVTAMAILPLHFGQAPPRRIAPSVTALLLPAVALALWIQLPSDYVVRRAIGPAPPGERILTTSEATTELLAVVERSGRGRGLLTNGHAMSSTAILDQRYMRAAAHVPLLLMTRPEHVLVIGFGVGNTAHAATLHSSVARVEIVDLSRHILEHAAYFEESHRGVLRRPGVSVFVNDGRQHLQMSEVERYDLITLEPPPIAHAGVSALYSREFYELARSRLTAGGYVSQWLPAYQVPAENSLSMVRAFIDVFPQSVLLSGAQAELLLLGTRSPRIELDPEHVAASLERESEAREDLLRLDLGTVREIAGMFVGSAETLARATAGSDPTTDDRPLQEYGVVSGLSAGLLGVPSALFDMTGLPVWCPRCGGPGAGAVEGLDLYLDVLEQTYLASPGSLTQRPYGERRILGSAYLGAVAPDSAAVRTLAGLAELRSGRIDEAVREFEAALARDPAFPDARAALGQIRYDQGADLLEAGQYRAAIAPLAAAVALLPDSAPALNDLGVALASIGRVSEARDYFQRAVARDPGFAEARRNLDAAQGSAGP
jgi:spermidine synthase